MTAPSWFEAFVKSLGTLSMTEMVRLQDFISQEIRRRFEKRVALGFSDVVGSTAHFERFGDQAGRRIQQRHFDLLSVAVAPNGGRIVDTAGDGAFIVFPDVQTAAESFIAFENARCADNATRPHDQQLEVRMAIHCGAVLTDGQHVTGDAVNLAARVIGSASPGEIVLTREAFADISPSLRVLCRLLGPFDLKGSSRAVEVYRLDWRERTAFPDRVRVVETGELIELPPLDVVRFGRLVEHGGLPANEIVLKAPDKQQTLKISRWHFELRRHPDGIRLRSVSDQLTEVDGQMVLKGVEAPVKSGTIIRVAQALTLELVGRPEPLASTAGYPTMQV
jgi:class 3 adenylate cyclase